VSEPSKPVIGAPGVEEPRTEWTGAEPDVAQPAKSEAYERTLAAGRRAMNKHAEALAELAK
jgi:hypothetical protein